MNDDAIRRSAKRLRIALFAAMALMAALYLAARFGLALGAAHVEYRVHVDSPYARLIGDVTTVLVLVALFRLTQMLGLVTSGEMLSAGVIGRFRSFASWLLIVAIFGAIAPVLAQALAPPANVHRLELAVDFREILIVGATLALFLVARLLERGRRLEEEMREFV